MKTPTKEMRERIITAMKAENLYKRPTYTVGELERLAKLTNTTMYDVMYVARYGRR